MRKIILYMTMTFDGFVAGPDNDLDWFTPPMDDPEPGGDVVGIVNSVDTWIMGYPTAPGMVAYWRDAEKNEKTEEWEMAIARAVNKLHPIAISNKEEKVGQGMELVVARDDDEFVKVVDEIKQRKGGDIYVPGGVRTGQKFARLGLVDEYIFMVHPVAIGEGKRLFTSKTRLELVSTKRYRSGVIQVRYTPRSLSAS
jgi:dihydrofolate reductase